MPGPSMPGTPPRQYRILLEYAALIKVASVQVNHTRYWIIRASCGILSWNGDRLNARWFKAIGTGVAKTDARDDEIFQYDPALAARVHKEETDEGHNNKSGIIVHGDQEPVQEGELMAAPR